MEKDKLMRKEVEIKEGAEVRLEGNIIIVNGAKGIIEKRLAYPGINFQIKDKKIILTSKKPSKHSKRILGTFAAHINNLILGVTQGYIYKLKICSGHFPMKVTVGNNEVTISNFLGEKIPRKARILDGTTAKLDGDIIIVEGLDKELVGQTAGNIELATRITNRDRRVFQDGCYLISKGE